MIRNEREYRITQAQAAEFERSLAALASRESDLHPALRQAQVNAVRSQLEDLRGELAEYDSLAKGNYRVLELSSLDDLPNALIKARIAAGLTQKELARRLGVPEQQVQRDEANEYSSTSFARLKKVASALKLGIREEVFLPNVEVSAKVLLHRLSAVGFDRSFLSRRFGMSASGRKTPDAKSVLESAGAVQRVFGWTTVELLASKSPLPPPRVAIGAYFKVPSNADETKTFLLGSYAKYIAGLAAKGTSVHVERLTGDASSFRQLLDGHGGKLNLLSVLRVLWARGIPVVPLMESGGFHAACWRFGGRNTIILKQHTSSEARWLHDLLHEVHHATQHPDQPDFERVDGDLTPRQRRSAPEEDDASSFAADVLLEGRAEELAQQCVKEAGGKVERLKSAVPKVAARNHVSVGALSNYMAWRLSLQSIDWWGAATNLQETTEDPWRVTRDFLAEHLDWSALEQRERELLTRAIAEE